MILSDGQVLDNLKFNEIIRDQEQNYQQALPLTFLNRTATTPADDDEIVSYFTGRVLAAPVIADDQEAPVYDVGNLEFVTNVIPNLKVGRRFSQGMISRLNRIRNNIRNMGGVKGDVAMFANWEVDTARQLIRAVNERKNAMICAMNLDSFNYASLGIQISGTWGMPGDLHFTASKAWSDPTATPITDILTAKVYAANKYGENYDRMTTTTNDLINMAGTTEFRQLIQGLVNQPLAATAFNARDPKMIQFASQLLGMEIEVENKLIYTQAANGTVSGGRVFPTGSVLFSNKADDNDPNAMDFGNAIVTESQVASLVGMPDTAAMGEQFGPFGYYTGNADLNPPNLTAWGVARGFPRKMRKTCTAVMTGV